MRRNIGLISFFVLASSVSALADTTDDFLQELAGKYSGKGVAKIVGDKRDRVICKVENIFDTAKSELSLSGNCASVKGKGAISGKISHTGNKLKGVLISSANVDVTKSSGEIVDNKLVLSTYTVNKNTGNLSRIRQIITKTKIGISAEFYRFDNKLGSYQRVGNLIMKQL